MRAQYWVRAPPLGCLAKQENTEQTETNSEAYREGVQTSISISTETPTPLHFHNPVASWCRVAARLNTILRCISDREAAKDASQATDVRVWHRQRPSQLNGNADVLAHGHLLVNSPLKALATAITSG
ncbi:hypothetical protein COCC4DRAFT_122220 [Bipolaris maydis ATCC 48331]|uniref:Uncharacterized protein n=1 Tax=Cochliobolus heterostrophus (strain C4 / ATCC 48331 / race T) TaxID=665024 RepID=N4XBM1_COCH4|nr:uncharacterized protein COCC4DRAFT_122220 [Bipolaris maydis ATCC 48331]ENI10424.1 hypothetical protein COCC4DRAFT_122220 [Bipolaris maydis ATCC 48331]